eukprot:jgi/Bigna1/143262/aug1.77_g17970
MPFFTRDNHDIMTLFENQIASCGSDDRSEVGVPAMGREEEDARSDSVLIKLYRFNKSSYCGYLCRAYVFQNTPSSSSSSSISTTYNLQGPVGRELNIEATEGSFKLSPASAISLEAVKNLRRDLHGVGLDWGTGVGLLALACAQLDSVDFMYGFDIEEENIQCSIENSRKNGLGDKALFLIADSTDPFDPKEREAFRDKRLDFVVANPPASDMATTDGFEFRSAADIMAIINDKKYAPFRIVLRDALRHLKPGGIVALQALSYYGHDRVSSACSDNMSGYAYEGIAASTDWVSLWNDEESESILKQQVSGYAQEEARGGERYYCHPLSVEDGHDGALMTATETVENVIAKGLVPLGKWQVHLFRRQD